MRKLNQIQKSNNRAILMFLMVYCL